MGCEPKRKEAAEEIEGKIIEEPTADTDALGPDRARHRNDSEKPQIDKEVAVSWKDGQEHELTTNCSR